MLWILLFWTNGLSVLFHAMSVFCDFFFAPATVTVIVVVILASLLWRRFVLEVCGEMSDVDYGKNGRNVVFKVSICFRGLNGMCRAFVSGRYEHVCDVTSKVVVVMLTTMANTSASARIWHNQDKFVVVKMWRQWKMDQRLSVDGCRCQSYLGLAHVCRAMWVQIIRRRKSI